MTDDDLRSSRVHRVLDADPDPADPRDEDEALITFLLWILQLQHEHHTLH